MSSLKSLSHFPNIFLDCASSNLSMPQSEDVLFVLDSVAHVFNISISLDKIDPLTVILNSALPNPVCYKETQQIYLTSKSPSWCQIAYQFAHELCHYSIAGNVPGNLRWLEESICEASSYYFLPKISKYWKRINVNKITPDGEMYYPCFTSYVEVDCKKSTPFDISQLCKLPISEISQNLIINPYMRNINSHIANCMLPIFKKYPLTWKAIPYLGFVNPGQHLTDSLKEWIALSPPKCHAGLIEFSLLFGAPELLL